MARVSAEFDFSRLEEYSEVYIPVSRGEGLPRSTQTYDESYRGTSVDAGGVPGVDSNIPGYVFGDRAAGSSEWERSEKTINYELNKTETHSTVPPGQVTSLSVSVWVNGELDAQQIENIEESVSRTTGLKVDRGDSIYVASVPFEESPFLADVFPPEIKPAVPLPWLVLGAVVLIAVVFLAVLGRRRPAEPEIPVAAGLDVVVDDDVLIEDELTPEERERLNMRKAIKKLAEDKPEEVAMLMKTWLADE